MQKSLKSTLAATLIPITVAIATVNFPAMVTAKPSAEITATKQLRGSNRGIYENYYTDNYERAIRRGIIRRPPRVSNEERAIYAAGQAMERGDRREVARRLAQALVAIEKKYGTREALEYEQMWNDRLEDDFSQNIREYLPLFARIFPTSRQADDRYYRDNYQRAINRGTIRRPSSVQESEAIQLAYEAITQGRRDEATSRVAQVLATLEQNNGNNAAANFEQRLNDFVEQQKGRSLREYLPVLNRIFPIDEDF